jgi:hypothetical protein
LSYRLAQASRLCYLKKDFTFTSWAASINSMIRISYILFHLLLSIG